MDLQIKKLYLVTIKSKKLAGVEEEFVSHVNHINRVDRVHIIHRIAMLSNDLQVIAALNV